jgi:amino acid adenylation domain-containing protein
MATVEPLISELAPFSPDGRTVVEMVGARAVRSPRAIAVAAAAGAMSYGELDRRSNRVARHLRSLGVSGDVPVGLCLPRSLDLVVGALGVLKAGGAYVPMDPEYPPDRLAFMLDDAQASIVIGTRELAGLLPAARRELVYLDEPEVAAQHAAPLGVPIAPDQLAYLIYTSGSTGRPKGVEISHRSLSNLISWHDEAFSVSAADRASHLAGLGFDASVWELWPYLSAGASVHLVDDDTRQSAGLLRDWLVAEGITIAFVPTPLAEPLLGLRWPDATRLRTLLTGGDVLRHYPPQGLPFSVVNNYGPTESTVVATSGQVPPGGSREGLPSIGRPIANTTIHLLDEHLRPVPPGAPGEIYIGGAGLARGYRGRPDLTAERFVTDPFDAAAGARLFRTGDLARQLPDGRLAFLGRIDDQIKIRGYRIEPSEIESGLSRHQSVGGVVVIAREDGSGDKRLVAYLVLDPDSQVTPAELRELLRESVPEYMIPAAFVRLDELPLTPNGKVDRAALPAPDGTNLLQDQGQDLPGTATEQRVAEILGELLEVDEIGLDDNFFLLGGHSLLGAQLIARLREAFGVEVGLRTLFEAPTVETLAIEVDRLVRKPAGAAGS